MISLKESVNDFDQYEKDIADIIRYIMRVGTIELENYVANVRSSSVGGDPGVKCFKFDLRKFTKGKVFGKYEDIVSLVFLEDDGNIFILKGHGMKLNYSTQLDFIRFMKELETELSVRSQERDSYNDSSEAFKELMKDRV